MAGVFGFKIISQYERGVVFRWGRALPGIREPGLTWVSPFTDRLRKVNMQITVAAVPGQETITRDNVTMRVDAVVYYRVVDPYKAIVNVQDYRFAVAQVAQTSLRAVTGRSDMDRLLSERQKVNAELKDVIGEPTEQPWGIRVERVEVKDVSLPEAMKRSMSRQAEAERERRARIIGADGEYQAARKLAQAASVMAADPAPPCSCGRPLQTVAEVAAEKNSHVIIAPVPMEGLRFLDRAASAAGRPIGQRGKPGPSRFLPRKPARTRMLNGSPRSQLCPRSTSCRTAAGPRHGALRRGLRTSGGGGPPGGGADMDRHAPGPGDRHRVAGGGRLAAREQHLPDRLVAGVLCPGAAACAGASRAALCRRPQLAGGGPGDGVQAHRVSGRPPARRQRTLRSSPRPPRSDLHQRQTCRTTRRGSPATRRLNDLDPQVLTTALAFWRGRRRAGGNLSRGGGEFPGTGQAPGARDGI